MKKKSKVSKACKANQAADKEPSAAQAAVEKLLRNETTAPNRFVRDLVEQVRAAQAEHGRLITAIETTERELAQARERRIICEGVSNNAVAMLVRWTSESESND